jgi:uncharacterized membrane protein YozB (DUF420 family)
MRSPESFSPVSPRPARKRVWQDVLAEGLLGMAVAVIALTAINPFVQRVSLWLAALIPGYDPVVTMLALVVLLVAVLVLGSIKLKIAARQTAEPRLAQPVRPRRARSWRSFPYFGS